MSRLAAQGIDQIAFIPGAHLIRKVFDGFRQRRCGTKIFHGDDGAIRRLGKMHLKENQFRSELINRGQHHHHFARSDLPPQVFALRFFVERLFLVGFAGVHIVKFTGGLQILEDSGVVVIFSPSVGDE